MSRADRLVERGGSAWWKSRYADLVERRLTIAHGITTYTPRAKKGTPPAPPPMVTRERLPRPEGMSRQVWRKLHRDAVKIASRAPRAG